jgi:WhiB family redox-sensing transcriptional regulator
MREHMGLSTTSVRLLRGEALMARIDVSQADQWLDRAWVKRAACAGHPELDWFSRSERMKNACRQVCAACAVRSECLAFAIANDETGIWAGLEQHQRRRLNCATA